MRLSHIIVLLHECWWILTPSRILFCTRSSVINLYIDNIHQYSCSNSFYCITQIYCLLANSGGQHVLGCVLVYLSSSMLPVSLNCPFLMTLPVFSKLGSIHVVLMFSYFLRHFTIFVFGWRYLKEILWSNKLCFYDVVQMNIMLL
jgi:hypothetical protein